MYTLFLDYTLYINIFYVFQRLLLNNIQMNIPCSLDPM